jgi:hypothetical protein
MAMPAATGIAAKAQMYAATSTPGLVPHSRKETRPAAKVVAASVAV